MFWGYVLRNNYKLLNLESRQIVEHVAALAPAETVCQFCSSLSLCRCCWSTEAQTRSSACVCIWYSHNWLHTATSSFFYSIFTLGRSRDLPTDWATNRHFVHPIDVRAFTVHCNWQHLRNALLRSHICRRPSQCSPLDLRWATQHPWSGLRVSACR